jgi:hypothetical protein
MWMPWQWARASNERAIANARVGSTACSQRRLERAEVELYLASRYLEPAPSTQPARPRRTNLRA